MAPGREIERKFLLSRPPGDLEGHAVSSIRQGYLAIESDGSEVRIRDSDGTVTLTVKRGRGLMRDEAEIELDARAFRALWPLTEDRRLEKQRYRMTVDGGLTVELDVFAGALEGLVLAEVEFPDETRAKGFEPPAWLGTEVTGDSQFSGQGLAVNGIPGGAGRSA